MSFLLSRRSPSLESLPSSTLSPSEDTPLGFFNNDQTQKMNSVDNIPTISGQTAPPSEAPFGDWSEFEGEFKAWVRERAAMRSTRAPKAVDSPFTAAAPPKPAAVIHKHERYCFPAQSIHFLVEGVIYSVHRYFFERDSSSFFGKGLTDDKPMVLKGVSASDFELFLTILYPAEFGVYTASTVEDWSAILQLADTWHFKSIRTLAIKQLAPIASHIDKIVLGRKYGVDEWLADAYEAVCLRDGPLTLEEGRRLGVDDVIRVNTIRHEYGLARRPGSLRVLGTTDVCACFGLACPVLPPAVLEEKAPVTSKGPSKVVKAEAQPPTLISDPRTIKIPVAPRLNEGAADMVDNTKKTDGPRAINPSIFGGISLMSAKEVDTKDAVEKPMIPSLGTHKPKSKTSFMDKTR